MKLHFSALSSALGFALALAGCDGCNKSVPAEAIVEASSPVDAAVKVASRPADGGRDAGVALWTVTPGATAAVLPNMGIPERFEIERSSRPPNLKVNVETVFAALEKASFTVVEKKQHLGSPFGARYCLGARVVNGKAPTDPTQFHLSVCEFMSEELARASRDYAGGIMAQVPNRAVHALKQTTLIIRGEPPMTPEVDAAMSKAFATYDALERSR